MHATNKPFNIDKRLVYEAFKAVKSKRGARLPGTPHPYPVLIWLIKQRASQKEEPESGPIPLPRGFVTPTRGRLSILSGKTPTPTSLS
jgi:hypothetical protein